LIFNLGFVNAALGVGPATTEIDVSPGLITSIDFNIRSDSGRTLTLELMGELGKYGVLNKDKIVNSQTVKASFNFAGIMDELGPGKHKRHFCVKELFDEELVSMFGTKIEVCAAIFLNMPHPGQYVEIQSFGPVNSEGNIGEDMELRMVIVSRGQEKVVVNPKIEISFSNQTKETIEMSSRSLSLHEKVELKKILDTKKYEVGDYQAKLIVEYGINNSVSAESSFRLGNLAMRLVKYTERVVIDGLKKFEVRVKSNWNQEIKNVYSEISIKNESDIVSVFRTVPLDVLPWQETSLQGYFETSDFSEGVYDVKMDIFYLGNKTEENGKVVFVERSKYLIVIGLGFLAIVLLIIAVYLVWLVLLLKRRDDEDEGKKKNSEKKSRR
jgi:hypothetical protein